MAERFASLELGGMWREAVVGPLEVTPRHALREADGKPRNIWIKAVGVAISYGSRPDHGHKPKDLGHKPKDHEHKPKDHGHKPKDYGHKPKDDEHKPKDHGHKPKYHGHKPKDHGHKKKDDGHKPKSYCVVQFVTPCYLVGEHVGKSKFSSFRGNVTLISAAIMTASVTLLKFLFELFAKLLSDVLSDVTRLLRSSLISKCHKVSWHISKCNSSKLQPSLLTVWPNSDCPPARSVNIRSLIPNVIKIGQEIWKVREGISYAPHLRMTSPSRFSRNSYLGDGRFGRTSVPNFMEIRQTI